MRGERRAQHSEVIFKQLSEFSVCFSLRSVLNYFSAPSVLANILLNTDHDGAVVGTSSV